MCPSVTSVSGRAAWMRPGCPQTADPRGGTSVDILADTVEDCRVPRTPPGRVFNRAIVAVVAAGVLTEGRDLPWTPMQWKWLAVAGRLGSWRSQSPGHPMRRPAGRTSER